MRKLSFRTLREHFSNLVSVHLEVRLTSSGPRFRVHRKVEALQFWHSRQYCPSGFWSQKCSQFEKPSLKQQQSISHLLSCYSTQPNPSTSIPIPSSSTTTYKSTVTDITNQQHNIHHVFELENGNALWLLWYFSKRSSTWCQCC